MEYIYDALGRRIYEHRGLTSGSQHPVHVYFSTAGQVLLEQSVNDGSGDDLTGGGEEEMSFSPMSLETTGVTNRYEYVWGPDYVNDLVMRDKDATANGSYESRNFVQHDANYDVTSITGPTTNADVLERYIYDPYGARTIKTSAFGSRSTSSYGWIYNFQSGRLDLVTGLTHFGARDMNSTLGRWMQQDYGGGYVDGGNLYEYVTSNPTSRLDPTGECWQLLIPVVGYLLSHPEEAEGVVEDILGHFNATAPGEWKSPVGPILDVVPEILEWQKEFIEHHPELQPDGRTSKTVFVTRYEDVHIFDNNPDFVGRRKVARAYKLTRNTNDEWIWCDEIGVDPNMGPIEGPYRRISTGEVWHNYEKIPYLDIMVQQAEVAGQREKLK